MENEVWKDVTGYEGIYQVSNLGRLKKLKKINKDRRAQACIPEHFIKGSVYTNGYIMVYLSKIGQKIRKPLHRIVAEEFIPNIENKPYVNHIDGNKQNNKASNLEWCTALENNHHAWRTGLIDKEKASQCGKKYIELNCRNRNKPVCQFTKEGIFINQFNSALEAERKTGISSKHIGSVCRMQRKSSGGYIWKYAEDNK